MRLRILNWCSFLDCSAQYPWDVWMHWVWVFTRNKRICWGINDYSTSLPGTCCLQCLGYLANVVAFESRMCGSKSHRSILYWYYGILGRNNYNKGHCAYSAWNISVLVGKTKTSKRRINCQKNCSVLYV